jgi:hypothetical protein
LSETCSDRTDQLETQPWATVRRRTVTLTLLTGDGALLASRCPGPLVSDVAAQLPKAEVPLDMVLRGHRTIRLESNRSFAAHGFAGTVTSTIAVAMGKVTRFPPPGTPIVIGHHPATRVVLVPLRLLAVSGQLVATVQSPPADLGYGARGPGNLPLGELPGAATCGRLGACGLTGNATITPRPAGSSGLIDINAPPQLSTRQLLAEIHGDQRYPGVLIDLTAAWSSGGRLDQHDLQSGTACGDHVPLGPGQLQLTIRHQQLNAQYEPLAPLRTRCAGPALGTGYVDGLNALASGSTPLKALRGRQVSLTLTAPHGTYYNGYPIQLSGAIAITVRLGPVSSHVIPAE